MGLLTELPNKTGDTIAQAVPGTSAQRLQEFLTNMQWDEEDLNRQHVQQMVAEAARGDGVLVFDDIGFPKQAKASVGVERQYAGTLGKMGTCQMAVACCDSDPQATWPVAVRWYLPKTWAYDPQRRQQTRVPEETLFRTKPEMSVTVLRRVTRHASIAPWAYTAAGDHRGEFSPGGHGTASRHGDHRRGSS